MRHLDFEGAINFRDIGGYRTADGRFVRWRKVYRSAELSRLSDADMTQIRALGITTVFDMRSDREREERPNRVDPTWAIEHLYRSYGHSNADFQRIIENEGLTADRLRQVMVELYHNIADQQSESIARIMQAIAAGRTPLLFHCAAGKDRTGATAALLLDVLGVPRETVVEDYMLTERVFETNWERFLTYGRRDGVPDEAWVPVLRAERDYIKILFDVIQERHGGSEGFFRSIGVDDAAIAAVRANLLVAEDEAAADADAGAKQREGA
jgi:protein-tyrosine phosphatase